MRRKRWERPRNVRPAVRAKRGRGLVTEDEAMTMFETGIEVGRAEESRARDAIHRVAEAIRTDSVEELAAELEAEEMLAEIQDFLDDQ